MARCTGSRTRRTSPTTALAGACAAFAYAIGKSDVMCGCLPRSRYARHAIDDGCVALIELRVNAIQCGGAKLRRCDRNPLSVAIDPDAAHAPDPTLRIGYGGGTASIGRHVMPLPRRHDVTRKHRALCAAEAASASGERRTTTHRTPDNRGSTGYRATPARFGAMRAAIKPPGVVAMAARAALTMDARPPPVEAATRRARPACRWRRSRPRSRARRDRRRRQAVRQKTA